MRTRNNCQNSNAQHDTYLSCVDNLKSVEYAIEDTFSIIKAKISKKQETTDHFDSSIKLLVLQLGIWSEARLNKLLNEYDNNSQKKLFTELELKLIKLNKQKIEQWKTIIELSFRKHYGIYIGHELKEENLGLEKFNQYTNIIEIVENHLKSIIEVRNKLAHGQWVCPLNDKGNLSSNSNFQELKNDNIVSLEKKYQILKYLTQTLHDLMISKATFERDFQKYYKEIDDRRVFLNKHVNKEYLKVIQKLQKKKVYRR